MGNSAMKAGDVQFGKVALVHRTNSCQDCHNEDAPDQAAGENVMQDPAAQRGAFTPQQTATLSKAMWRIVPFLFICYIIAYLDRVNVGFAALSMNKNLGLSPIQYGWGVGLFFFGYFALEIPSNLMLQRIGARVWIARIMITWGLISACTSMVTGPVSFYVMRFLLGLAEAGFVPGVFLYLASWFPGVWRSRTTATFLVGIPVAGLIGSPVSGLLLNLEGWMGLHGWQWLLIMEGLPAVLLGIVCLFVLSDRPAEAQWLLPEERAWLSTRMAEEHRDIGSHSPGTLRAALSNPGVLICAATNFAMIMGSSGVAYWTPLIIRNFGLSYTQVGLVTAIPPAVATVAMVLWARSADRTGRRVAHVAATGILGFCGLAFSAFADTPGLAIAGLTATVVASTSFQATFWAIPPGFLTGRAAAGGIALIVSVGNLGGFTGPYLVGYLKQTTDSYQTALLLLSCCILISALLVTIAGRLIANSRTTVGREGKLA
jgi:ACS family tartrate transporter-like MFS transporter